MFSKSRLYIFVLPVLLVMVSMALAACGGDKESSESADQPANAAAAAVPAGDPDKGKEIFSATCFACHGEGGVGVPNLGKDMTSSTFIHQTSDTDLMAFIKKGRDPSDPLNTTGVAMPSKGGNPALSDEDLMDVIAYVRTLNVNVK